MHKKNIELELALVAIARVVLARAMAARAEHADAARNLAGNLQKSYPHLPDGDASRIAASSVWIIAEAIADELGLVAAMIERIADAPKPAEVALAMAKAAQAIESGAETHDEPNNEPA